MTELKQLEIEIENLRYKMEQQAEKMGMTHPEVIQMSQKLDELHNQWNRRHQTKPFRLKEDGGVYIIRRYSATICKVAMSRA